MDKEWSMRLGRHHGAHFPPYFTLPLHYARRSAMTSVRLLPSWTRHGTCDWVAQLSRSSGLHHHHHKATCMLVLSNKCSPRAGTACLRTCCDVFMLLGTYTNHFLSPCTFSKAVFNFSTPCECPAVQMREYPSHLLFFY